MIENFAQRIKLLLGESLKSRAVAGLLKELDVTEPPKTNPDTPTAYVSRKNLGFSLLFKEPAKITNPAYSSLPGDVPILTGCFFYSDGHDGYTQFSGSLPGGLQFADTLEQLVGKLGEPLGKREKNCRTVAEKWEIDGRSFHVTYKAKPASILVLSFSIPQNF